MARDTYDPTLARELTRLRKRLVEALESVDRLAAQVGVAPDELRPGDADILRAYAQAGGTATRQEVAAAVGLKVSNRRYAQARTRLGRLGYLTRAPGGAWRLTESGREKLEASE